MQKNKFIAVAFLFLTGTALIAQNMTSSPYTRYGIGLLENSSFGRSQGMGSAGIALRSNLYINSLNPASFSSIDTLSEIYQLGFNGQIAQFSDGSSQQNNTDFNFTNLAMAFPISKQIGASIGVNPLSTVGYEYSVENDIDNIGIVKSLYGGSGGITEAYLGFGYKPFKYISLGAKFSYIFGFTEHSRLITFNETSFNDFSSYEKLSISAFHPIFGTQIIIPFKAKNSLVLGAVYEPKTGLNAKQDYTSLKSGVRTFFVEQRTDMPVEIEMPQAYGAGLSYVLENKLTITGDYYFQEWSNAKFYGKTDSLKNRVRFAGGVEYIPNYIDRSYLKRVEYRVGAYYSENYLSGFEGDLYNFGMTFGFGLPLRYSKTRFNIAFELGQMKSSNSSLISENYAKLNINFSFSEFWFMRRKFE